MRIFCKIPLLIVVVFAGGAFICGCSKEPELKLDSYMYEPVRMACAYVAMVEKPDAARALLIGEEAKLLSPTFNNAGVKTYTAPDGKFDLVVVACREMSAESCGRLKNYLTENGVVVWLLDVDGVTAGKFRRQIYSFALAGVHLWMPGAGRWVLTGRKTARTIKLSAMLDVFTRESAFDDMAKARCETLPEMFANYVGTREDVIPAFAMLNLSEVVCPENFITKDVRPVEWISDEGMDNDIASGVIAEIRSMQTVRRQVLEGNMKAVAATDKHGEEEATEIWARTMLRNPNDLFMLERLDRLDRNARGFLEVGKLLQAMKCYETMVLIRPIDAAAVHNFGMCLKKLGKLDMAEKVLERARKLWSFTIF